MRESATRIARGAFLVVFCVAGCQPPITKQVDSAESTASLTHSVVQPMISKESIDDYDGKQVLLTGTCMNTKDRPIVKCFNEEVVIHIYGIDDLEDHDGTCCDIEGVLHVKISRPNTPQDVPLGHIPGKRYTLQVSKISKSL